MAVMFQRLFARILAMSPSLNRRVWQGWYDILTSRYQKADWTFMNYGYSDPDPSAPRFALSASDEPNRYFIQLYHHVASAVSLKGKSVLEVGSGRGGGSSYIAREFGPSAVTGVDCSEKAITFCNQVHSFPTLKFAPGDCESLPFPDGAIDAVVNVESSHCYPSMSGFLNEVARVLRPGGHLLWADLRAGETSDDLRKLFEAAGFKVLQDRIITPNVLAALDQITERKQEMIERNVPRLFRPLVSDFAGVRGTKVYDRFLTGTAVYYSFTLQKPEH